MPKTPISAPIASADFLWRRPDGSEIRIQAKVGRPYLVTGTEWACPCAIDGLDGAYPDIHGEGSVQALCLALSLIHQRLVHLLEGGEHLFDLHGHEALDLKRLQVVFGLQVRANTGASG